MNQTLRLHLRYSLPSEIIGQQRISTSSSTSDFNHHHRNMISKPVPMIKNARANAFPTIDFETVYQANGSGGTNFDTAKCPMTPLKAHQTSGVWELKQASSKQTFACQQESYLYQSNPELETYTVAIYILILSSYSTSANLMSSHPTAVKKNRL